MSDERQGQKACSFRAEPHEISVDVVLTLEHVRALLCFVFPKRTKLMKMVTPPIFLIHL